jgi:pimeloyl-ACP methyl ester carboxylesterase
MRADAGSKTRIAELVCEVTPDKDFYQVNANSTMYVRELAPLCSVPTKKHTVVFVHGCCHSGNYLIQTPDLRPGFARLFQAAGFSVLVPDLPDHGLSPPSKDWLTTGLQPTVEQIQDLVKAQDSVILIGHSMGGQVITRALVDDATKTKTAAVILLAPVSPPELIQPGQPELPTNAPVNFPKELAKQLFASTPHFPIEAFDRYAASLWPESPTKTNEFQQPKRAPEVGAKRLSGLPALIVGGEKDFIPAVAWKAQADYLGAEFKMLGADFDLADHGHMFMIERGNEKIADVLIEWLDMKKR